MKAVRYHSYGDSGVLVYEEADHPAAGAGQVVVKVAGAAFNPLDVAIRAGFVQQMFPVAFPHIPNYDVAGVITEAGEGVSGWSAGDPVVAFLPVTAPGAAAEYAAAPAEALAAAPRAVELADGVVYSRSGLTYQAGLLEQAGLITRAPSPDDERATLVTITDNGRALLGRVMPGHILITRLLLDPLSDQDVDQLRDIMTRVRDHMRAQPPRSASPRKRRG